jgi:FkbM family methyltransferase
VSRFFWALPRCLGERFYRYHLSTIDPLITVEVLDQPLHFLCPTPMAAHRARAILREEPETIQWLSTFEPGEVFWDIGANVGTYSLVAAQRQCKVFAIEPSPFNYYGLCRNVEANGLSEQVSSFCIAVDSEDRLDYLYMASTGVADAGTNFAEAVDAHRHAFQASYSHATLGFRLDDFIRQFQLPLPNHLKIDVDGNEDKVVAGAIETLNNRALRSISVELNDELPDQREYVHRTLLDAGFAFAGKKRAPEVLKAAAHTPVAMYNHHFVRELDSRDQSGPG